MTEDHKRWVDLTRLGLGRYLATNPHGDTLSFGSTGDGFSPVELLLAAVAGCTAADVDHITAKRAEPLRFRVHIGADKVRDTGGNRLDNLSLSLDIDFPEGEGGDKARAVLPDAAARSHDRLCTVSRTVERGTPVDVDLAGTPVLGAAGVDLADLTGETERLLLRPYASGDLDALADLHRREDVTRYLPWDTRDLEAARAALDRHQDMCLRREGDAVTLAGFDKDSGRLVGEFVLIRRSIEHRGGEVGYLLHPDFWGRGLATEGARAVLQLGFETVGMRRIVARIDSRNTGSAAVLERLGMRHEAHLVQNELFKGEWSDEDDYAMLASEWEQQPTPAVTWRRKSA